MRFYHDRQIQGYAIFLLSFSLLLLVMSFSAAAMQKHLEKDRYISHENRIASSLIEQGIPKDIIAIALTNQLESNAGKELLDMLAIEKQDNDFGIFYITAMMNIVWMVFLFAGTLIFWRKRRGLYLRAETILNQYINDDYSSHLPQNSEGLIYRMFSSIEQLATMLQSQKETEHKTKEFLKRTISDISHQLKTPLAALSMYQEIMENEPDHAEIVEEFAVKSAGAIKRMEQLIQSMLKITRLDTASVVFQKKPYQVSELISYSLSELNMRARAEQKELIVSGNPDDMVLCDMEWTGEAIGNIVKNALDHTDAGGIIHISWERSQTVFRIWIRDNGKGIAPEDIHHIFKRFYRSKNSIDTQGVGLGLSLAKSIIDGQGGVISVQSSPHEGTTFILSFLTEL